MNFNRCGAKSQVDNRYFYDGNSRTVVVSQVKHPLCAHLLYLILPSMKNFRFLSLTQAGDLTDDLVPYLTKHGSRLSHRAVRECQPAKYANVTHEVFKSHFNSDNSIPLFTRRMFAESVGEYSWDQRSVSGNLIQVGCYYIS